MTEDQGASSNELMLALCRGDQEEELENLLDDGQCDVTFVDGAGNSAVHYAAKSGSIGCLEVLVNHDDVDLDIQNTLEGNTPLHVAVQYANEDHEMAVAMVELLLAGGANPHIQNKNKLTPLMLANPQYKDIKEKLQEAAVAYDVDESDIAYDEVVDDEESGSGSSDEEQ